MKKVLFNKNIIILLFSAFFYLLTHTYQLTLLPVFADEAIYIRWSQLIIDEPLRYLFFPLNDGKTPLQMWLMIPFLKTFSDSLFAGRILSVLIGLGQMISIGYLTKIIGGKKKATYLAMLFTSILPFWYFHHRMALTDPLYTLFATLAIAFSIKSLQETKFNKNQINFIKSRFFLFWILISGLFLGLGFWSKLPIILLTPAIGLSIFLIDKKNWIQRVTYLIEIGIIGIIGMTIFLSLKLNPAFGQLFSRGSDFLYPLSEILAGGWQTTIQNIPTYLNYFIAYLTLPVILLMLYGLFSPTMKRQQWWLFLSTLSFFLPIAIMGKVVYPRYFLPISIFFTISASLAIEEIINIYIFQNKSIQKKFIYALIVASILSNIILISSQFIIASITKPASANFVSADRTQYFTEWSSGDGIRETVDYIKNQAQDHTIAVATEGYFGTLPDAILMYLHGENVNNIYVEGIGQPVAKIPEKFIQRAKNSQQIILVVNSHRLQLNLEQNELINQYCRSFDGPCLQLWDVTNFINSSHP